MIHLSRKGKNRTGLQATSTAYFKGKDLVLLNKRVHNYMRKQESTLKVYLQQIKNGVLTAYCQSQRLKFVMFPSEHFVPTKSFWKSNFFWKKLAVSRPVASLTLMSASTDGCNHVLAQVWSSVTSHGHLLWGIAQNPHPLAVLAHYHYQKYERTVFSHKRPDLVPFIHLPIFRKVIDILYPWGKAQEIPSWQPKWDNSSSSIPLQSAKICLICSRVRNPWGLTDLLEQQPATPEFMGLLAWDLASSSFPQNLRALLTRWRGFIIFLLSLFLWLHVNDLFHRYIKYISHNRYGRFRS